MIYDPQPLIDRLGWDSYVSYRDVLDTFGEVVLSERLGSWEGDYVAVVKRFTGQYGFLVFGYGSCSGCDTLEAINGTRNSDELAAFAKSLYSSIRWFDSMADLSKWLVRVILKDEPEPGPWYYYDNDVKEWARGFSEGVLGEG